VKRITKWRPPAVRMIGRLKSRWEDYVRADLEKRRSRIGIRWLWTEKHGREMLSRPQLIKSCSKKKIIYQIEK